MYDIYNGKIRNTQTGDFTDPNDQDYLDWTEQGNTAILYVEPELPYTEKRKQEYPSIEEMTVALWEKTIENRPEAADALEVKRQAIKTKYPK